MASVHIFISHASKDDDFVKELRTALESQRLPVWVDSRNLRGGAKLAPEIEQAIETARQTIAVLSPNTINSPWVRREIQQALAVEKRRGKDGYRVIPLLLPGVEPSALALWFDEEPVGVKIELKVGSVSEALPQILAALGERLPTDYPQHKTLAQQTTPQKPVEELLVKLSDPKVETIDGKRRASATATLVYEPADAAAREVESKRFNFTAPLGPIEADDLRWYLEEFFRWPIGVFKERADGVAARLPDWGKRLFDEAAKTDSAKDALNAWRNAADSAGRLFSVMVDSELPDGASAEDQAAANEAASLLLSLPWELLSDGRGFLFHGKNPVRVRRRLPNRNPQKSVTRELPIRILLLSPRPEEQGVAYLDHRISARPLVEAIEALGELAKLTILSTPTFAALQAELKRAADAGQPYDVVHFDGHGVYDRKAGLGGLCFEDPNDADKLEDRAMRLVYARELAEVMRDHRIPLIFLEACQSAQTEENPSASVAASLLNEGVTSVVAMSHSVLVETAHRFVRAFYGELAGGARIGTAMLAGQRALQTDSHRGRIMGAGDLHLQDWFVPVLYQEAQDPRLVTQLPSEQARQLLEAQRRLSLGRLPSPPPHTFIGRSRELLKLERLLMKQAPAELRYAVVRGVGGQGKTTLAVEAARWFLRTGRFRRAAFVSLEHYTDARGVLDSLGKQLLPEGDNWSVAHFPDLRQALQPVARVLSDHPTIIVLDNLESVLPGISTASGSERADSTALDAGGALATARGTDSVDEIFLLCQSLLQADERTRLLFTTREPLPEPFNHRHREITLGALSREDAIELVGEVMRQDGLTPKHDDAGNTPQEIIDLVEAVNRHARALTLMAREVACRGVRVTSENLHQLMAELDRKNPNDPEKSLFACVDLSFRRLTLEERALVMGLSLSYGGVHVLVLAHVAGVDVKAAETLSTALIEVGLGEYAGHGHICLHPALPPYLLERIGCEEEEQLRKRWAEEMQHLVDHLHWQQFKDSEISTHLTLLELPNLLQLLKWIRHKDSPEKGVLLACRVEQILSELGRPQELAQVIEVREEMVQNLEHWCHARFEAMCATVDRLLEQGGIQTACIVAERLRQACFDAGEQAYPEAAFDLAMAYCKLGTALAAIGDAENALPHLAEAQQRFIQIAEIDASYARMIYVTISEIGDCLKTLRLLDEAEMTYQEAIRLAERECDKRAIIVSKGNWGYARMLHGDYGEALRTFAEVRTFFAITNEASGVAIGWHNAGIAHRLAGQYQQAEIAYKQSLAISVRLGHLESEASTLNELGVLYSEMGYLEYGAVFSRQAADIYAALGNLQREGRARHNIGVTLARLNRFGEARRELHRAIVCKQPYGIAGQLWGTWSVLHNLEQATGDAKAAAAAREQAIASYLAYRRAGGESQSDQARLFALVFQAIQQGTTPEAEQTLAEWSEGDVPTWGRTLLAKLQTILRGDRDTALAADPNLFYDNAVELQLLLEALETK